MEGNLSKKKGLLSAIENVDKDYIAKKVYDESGFTKKDLEEVQANNDKNSSDIKINKENIETIRDDLEGVQKEIETAKKDIKIAKENISEHDIYMGEMAETFEERVVGIEGKIEAKEDISNKINSLNMGGIYDDNQYPTAQAVCGFVDEEKANTINTIIDNYYDKNTLDEKIEAKEDVSNKISSSDFDGMPLYEAAKRGRVDDNQYPTAKYVGDSLALIESTANMAYDLANGVAKTISFENYTEFCEWIINEGSNFGQKYPIGSMILIKTLNVPDLWYYGASDNYIEIIPTDEVIIYTLKEYGHFDIGYFRFAQIEQQLSNFEESSNKTLGGNIPLTHPDNTIVSDENYPSLAYLLESLQYFKENDLDERYPTKEYVKDYVKNTDYTSNTKAGVVMVDASLGIYHNGKGYLNTQMAANEEIDEKIQKYKPIVPANLEYAVKSCTNQDSSAELTEEQLKLPPSTKYLNDVIGDIETALENIIAKYGLGGDAS